MCSAPEAEPPAAQVVRCWSLSVAMVEVMAATVPDDPAGRQYERRTCPEGGGVGPARGERPRRLLPPDARGGRVRHALDAGDPAQPPSRVPDVLRDPRRRARD